MQQKKILNIELGIVEYIVNRFTLVVCYWMIFYPLTIESMTICVICGSDSRGHKYCYECSDKRSNACSIINQNKKKLARLLTGRCSYDVEWIRKFSLYVDNIVKQLGILEKFRMDERRFFEEKEDE